MSENQGLREIERQIGCRVYAVDKRKSMIA
jgi:hypothetical protein